MAILTKSLIAAALLSTLVQARPIGLPNTLSSVSTVIEARAISASTSGSCANDANACVGDVTHWDGGLGACGETVDTATDYAVALPYEFMGTLSNTNPMCNDLVTLYNPNSGTTVKAAVKDKCMGCTGRSLDTTDILFNFITDGQGNGRYSGIQWWFD